MVGIAVITALPRRRDCTFQKESRSTRQVNQNYYLSGTYLSNKIISAGNVYIADIGNSRIRKVTVSTGIITTFAGTGTSSYSGDNGPATSAAFNEAWGVALDSTGTTSSPTYPLD